MEREKAEELLSQKDGKVRREFPSQWLNKTFEEIEKASKREEDCKKAKNFFKTNALTKETIGNKS